MNYWLKITGTGERPFEDGDWTSRREGWRQEYGEVRLSEDQGRRAEELIREAAGEYGSLVGNRHFG